MRHGKVSLFCDGFLPCGSANNIKARVVSLSFLPSNLHFLYLSTQEIRIHDGDPDALPTTVSARATGFYLEVSNNTSVCEPEVFWNHSPIPVTIRPIAREGYRVEKPWEQQRIKVKIGEHIHYILR